MTEENIKVQEYWQGFPEAPASDTFKWVDGLGFEHMTTIRAWSGTILYGEVAKFVAHINETGGKTTAPQHAPSPAPVSAPKSAPAPSGEQFLTVNKIKVTPEVKDGKQRIQVEIYEANMKWPSIKAFYNDASQATAAWGMVTGLDFSTAGEYQLEAKAFYRNSDKLNQKGNPYKNLVSVVPLD